MFLTEEYRLYKEKAKIQYQRQQSIKKNQKLSDQEEQEEELFSLKSEQIEWEAEQSKDKDKEQYQHNLFADWGSLCNLTYFIFDDQGYCRRDSNYPTKFIQDCSEYVLKRPFDQTYDPPSKDAKKLKVKIEGFLSKEDEKTFYISPQFSFSFYFSDFLQRKHTKKQNKKEKQHKKNKSVTLKGYNLILRRRKIVRRSLVPCRCAG